MLQEKVGTRAGGESAVVQDVGSAESQPAC